MASLARIALSLASSIEFPLATATPNLLLPEIEGFPNNRIWVSGSFSALSTSLNEISSELPSPSMTLEALGPCCMMFGIGRPKMALA